MHRSCGGYNSSTKDTHTLYGNYQLAFYVIFQCNMKMQKFFNEYNSSTKGIYTYLY